MIGPTCGQFNSFLQILLLQTCQGDNKNSITNPSKDATKDVDTVATEQHTVDPGAESNNSNAQSMDARRGNPLEPPTIEARTVELRRPHTLLLMSTVAGGGAERGLFTGAIATALQRDKGEEIYNTFRTGVQLTGRECPGQTPVMYSTLKKSLVLHPSRCSHGVVNG